MEGNQNAERGFRDRTSETMGLAHRGRPAIRSGLRRPGDARRDGGCLSPTSIPVQHPPRNCSRVDKAKRNALLTNVASAYLRNWYCLVPSGTSLRGLKVRVLPLRSGCDQRRSMPASVGGQSHRPKNADISKCWEGT